MTKQFVCDVCGEPYELDQPHLELTIQEGVPGPDLSGVFDICSWACAYELATVAGGDETEEEGITAEFIAPGEAKRFQEPSIEDFKKALSDVGISGQRIVDDVHDQQIVIDKQDRQYAKEVEDAGVGVYFPEGMRVDGRPASQIRRQVPKVRLVRDDD